MSASVVTDGERDSRSLTKSQFNDTSDTTSCKAASIPPDTAIHHISTTGVDSAVDNGLTRGFRPSAPSRHA